MQNTEARYNNFTLLRLLLATLVILSHSLQIAAGGPSGDPLVRLTGNFNLGDIAVDAFLVISGFLITQSWEGAPRPKEFLAKRIARIYPGFVLCGLLCGLVAAPMMFGWKAYYSVFPWTSLVAWLLVLQFHGPTIVDNVHDTTWPFNGPTYSVFYEFLCYLGLLVLGWSGLLGKRFAVPLVYAATALVFLFRTNLVAVNNAFYVEYVFIPLIMVRFAIFFLAGVIYYQYRKSIRFNLTGYAVAGLVAGTALFLGDTGSVLLSLSLPYLVFGAAFAPVGWLRRCSKAPDISYGTYLYAWPIQMELHNRFLGLSAMTCFFLATGLAYACGFASWELLEKRALKLAHRGKSRPITSPPAEPALK